MGVISRFGLTACLLALTLAPAHAADKPAAGMGIAAVVGGEAVTSYDVENRIRFILVTARLSNTQDVIERIRPQVVRSLIDEHLQLQEAAKNNVAISDGDVTQAVAAIEQQRGIPAGEIDRILQGSHIDKSTFTQQVRAQLSWNKLISQKVRPRIKISEPEIEIAGRKMTLPDTSRPQELQISVLALPIDKPSREGEMRKLADKLAREIRAGASFEEVSRQFSGSLAGGGKAAAFWVRPEQLEPSVAKALANAQENMVTEPVRTQEGYSIVKVYQTRAVGPEPKSELDITLKEILLKMKPDASGRETDAMLQIGEDVARHPGTCEEKGIANIENLKDFDIEVNIYHNLMSELPAALKVVADGLKVGDVSTPFASKDGIRLYMLCGKKESNGKKIDRERVYAVLMQQKMDLEAQKYLRNLRRDTFIEIREP